MTIDLTPQTAEWLLQRGGAVTIDAPPRAVG